MTILIRNARTNDLTDIADLNGVVQSLHAEAEPWLFKTGAMKPEDLSGLLEKPGNRVLVAELDGAVVGYVFAEHRKIPETPLTNAFDTLHIHHIAVSPEARRAGIAAALVERVKAIGAELGVYRVTADVWSFDEPARALFTGSGLSPYMMRLWL